MSASSPVTTTSISTSSAAAARGRATSFIPELQSMMFSLGDVRRPLQESAALVEDIVHTQLLNILQQAGEVALTRGARVISPEDIVFLMRRDKNKLQRLVKYLHFRDYKSRILKSVEDEEPLDSERVVSGQHRRQRLLQDFLSSIDQTGEFQTLVEEPEVDEVKQERLERMERMTRNMDAAQYSDFCESRQLSFSKKASKFRDWLDCSALEVKPSVVSMEVLSYLAYETVAQLVDLALLVKQDMSARAGDVFRQAASATFIQYSEAAGVKREAESPENTPPSTPQLKNGGVAQDSAKAKQRKRKKSAAAASGAEPVSGAITPSHIREAVRRYSSREPLSSFSSVFRRTGMTFLTC